MKIRVIRGQSVRCSAFNVDCSKFGEDVEGVIGKLHRYEAHIERGLYRALHELQRLQATRHGQIVPAPTAMDVTIHPPPEPL